MSNPFGPGPFQPNPFGGSSFAPQQQPAQPPPVAPRDEANVLATLSVVFAFVFAPAGLILGHLGLAQIRRTGQRGRDRALVGVTLSYVFITALVVALIVRATLPDSTPTHVAVPATTTTKPPSGTTPRPAAPPRPPIVTPSDLPGLLPSLDEVKTLLGTRFWWRTSQHLNREVSTSSSTDPSAQRSSRPAHRTPTTCKAPCATTPR
ncbi:hypothetical protein MCOL_V206720 [Mycobacterium colombiense CECT 3035]|uniref:DUF4190 domain-containing protein n=1 Tax=Mycobacterium colombiense CECT 3035 TaxID=1041522 RepID=J5EEF9_9MYCO|nr:hypothetical protein MCOL_V206720 [Mycobacterium colombiense CECT 3035]